MKTIYLMAGSTLLFVMLAAQSSRAQTPFGEDFTGPTTVNSWYFIRGACLTAGSASVGPSPGQLPGCLAVKSASYFGENLVGGTAGVSGNNQTLPDLPDPVTGAQTGALRFTNGYPFGHNEGGAIISSTPFSMNQGVEITFKSISYRGDSGGGVSDGADGISFFMMDGSVTPSIGSQGGSLGYTCSNPGNIGGHPSIDGVVGGYIGLGIDEYGNFLNANDNTASGPSYQGNRIGLRGAGNVAWRYLNANYPNYYPSSLSSANQQSAVAKTCQTGILWDYSIDPSNPTAALTAGTPVTGTLAGKIAKRSNQITSIPLIPASLIIGATITDTNGYFNGGTTYTVTAIGSSSITISPQSNGNPSGGSGSADNFHFTSITPGQNIGILDYLAIPGGSAVLSGVKIANEAAMRRQDATPIFYNLKVTQNGLLSLAYSIGGAAYQSIITNADLTLQNGPLPTSFRFGFAGSTGGSTNIHEIMCFKAAPNVTSGSSATVNEKESAKVETSSQAFFAFYNPSNWTGTVTANTLIDTAGVVTVSSVANWDAACLLTGTASGTPLAGGGCATTNIAGPTSATPVSTGRVMLTWDTLNNVGIPFEFASLNSNQQATLDALDATQTGSRLNFLRGSRTNEINTSGVGLYRFRASVLGDIVDSSPSWVGPPILPYTATWTDRLQPSTTMAENSGTQNYVQYVTAETSRANIVYVGANDGFLHGFRAGSLDSGGNLITTTTPNDGREVLAYMPGSTLQSAAFPTVPATLPPSCTDHSHTQSLVQNIHGVTPAFSTNPLCVDSNLDLTSAQYGHNFFVDATPGTGDLFYNGVWHTWLVGGLGAGGAAIYALDITNPSNFAETNASSLVVGEWNPSTITCSSSCGGNLGNTFGTPQIRRLHNGQWGVIFGNGIGSSTGDAGIYVMTINVSGSGALSETFHYLSTGHAGGNGIAYVTPVDLDGDHVTDYVYAGDLKGNIWRFDLTNANPALWAAASTPLFTTPSGQPITTQLLAISSAASGPQRLMIEFATGQRVQLTNTNAVSYASGTQAIYGIWDWNFSAWNAMSGTQYASLAATTAATGLASPFTIPSSGSSSITALTQQVLTVNTTNSAQAGIREGTNVAVCWQGGTTCSGGPSANNKFGWYVQLPGTSGQGSSQQSEQVIFNPVFFQGAILVDSTIPASNSPIACNADLDTGFTYALNVANGGIFTNAFPNFKPKNGIFTGVLAHDSQAAGVETDATGSVFVVKTQENMSNIIFQTVTGTPSSQQINIPANTKSKRLTWVERR
jgi:type IV pilus assembly protein PilY1